MPCCLSSFINGTHDSGCLRSHLGHFSAFIKVLLCLKKKKNGRDLSAVFRAVLLRNCNLSPPAGHCVHARGGQGWTFLDLHKYKSPGAACLLDFCRREQPYDNYLKTPSLHEKSLQFLESLPLELCLPSPPPRATLLTLSRPARTQCQEPGCVLGSSKESPKRLRDVPLKYGHTAKGPAV